MPLSPVANGLVFDTNVVLDWLLFGDAGVAAVADAVQQGRLRWLACQRMRDEFEHTLLRPELARWQPDTRQLLARFDSHAQMLDAPRAPSRLLCSDPEDQVFIDFALETGAGWLLSHDFGRDDG